MTSYLNWTHDQNDHFKCQYDHLVSLPKYSNGTLSWFNIKSKLLLYDVLWLRQLWPLPLLFISPNQGQTPCCFLNVTRHVPSQMSALLIAHLSHTSSHPWRSFPDQPEGNISPSFRIHSHCFICHYDTYYYLTYFTFTGPCIYYLSLLTN